MVSFGIQLSFTGFLRMLEYSKAKQFDFWVPKKPENFYRRGPNTEKPIFLQ